MIQRSSSPTLYHGQEHLSLDQGAQSLVQPDLDTSNDGASTTSLCNPFQCLMTLIIKNSFLMFNLNLPSFSLIAGLKKANRICGLFAS